MGFAIFLITCNILIPIVMIIFGWVCWNHPPKSINGVYGYRTTMSMKNQETWEFAHQYCGKLWEKAGLIMLVPTLVVIFFSFLMSDEIQGIICIVIITIQTIVLIISIFPVEKALKKNFDKDGHRL